MILDKMEMLDQQIAAAWPIGEERPDVFESLRVKLPAFWRARGTTAATTARGGLMFNHTHRSSLLNPEKRI
jgi:hypothetical protein